MGSRVRIAAVLACLAVVAIMIIYIAMSGLMGGSIGFERSDLVAPSIKVLQDEDPVAPGNLTSTYFPAHLQGGFVFMPAEESGGSGVNTAFVYRDCGGFIDNINIKNIGATTVFIWAVGIRWDGNDTTVWKNVTTTLESGEEADMGLLYLPGPGTSGYYSFELVLEIWTSPSTNSGWYDYGEYVMDSDLSLRSVSEPEYEERTVMTNIESLYVEFNDLVNFDAVVEEWVTPIEDAFPGEYDLLQVIAAYEMVQERISYLSDQSDTFEGDDHWQTVEETLSLGTGDCEDQAILMSSIVTALGGSCRINLIDGHAFSTVYIGDSENDTSLAVECVRAYYGTDVPVFWIQDSFGYWMVIDTAGMPYAGGCPASSVPIDSSGGIIWNFEDDDWIKIIDITGETFWSGFF